MEDLKSYVRDCGLYFCGCQKVSNSGWTLQIPWGVLGSQERRSTQPELTGWSDAADSADGVV